jgi:hypothetical protein
VQFLNPDLSGPQVFQQAGSVVHMPLFLMPDGHGSPTGAVAAVDPPAPVADDPPAPVADEPPAPPADDPPVPLPLPPESALEQPKEKTICATSAAAPKHGTTFLIIGTLAFMNG